MILARERFRSMLLAIVFALAFVIIFGVGSTRLIMWANLPTAVAESAEIAGMRQVGLTPGDLAPDFTLPSVDGTKISLSGFRGRTPVLVNLWTVSCPSCHMELEELKLMHEDYRDRVEILSVSLDSWYPASFIKQLAEDKGLPFTVLIDERSTVANLYKVSSVPANYLIDERGVILGVFIGLIDRDRMKNEVEPLLP